MSAHARLAPSSAPIWGHCSGSVQASLGRVDTVNERTIQGTAAHWVMEQCAKNWRSSTIESALFCADWVGKVDPDGTVITREIAEGAQYILDDMLKAVNQFGGYSHLLVEQRVVMTRIHPTDNEGTVDLALYYPQWNNGQGLLIMWDYKHGHSLVRAKDNLQLVDYVAGLYEAFAIPAHTQVRLRIVQPFAYAAWGPVDEHIYGAMSDLFPLFGQLSTKAHEAMTNPKLTAGKHCRYCPARVNCSAAREYGYLWGSICEMPYDMDDMGTDDMARESDILAGVMSVVKARKEAIDDALKAALSAGKPCSVKCYESVEGRRAWVEGQEQAAIAAFQSIGLDVRNKQPVTPQQAIGLLPKSDPKRSTAEAIQRSMSTVKMSIKLIDRDDSLVARAFGAKQPLIGE